MAKDFDKRTPIDIALAEGYQEVAEVMKNYVNNPAKRTSSFSSSSSSSSSSTPTGVRSKKRTKKRSFSLYDEEDDDDYKESDAAITNQGKASRHAYATRSSRTTNG